MNEQADSGDFTPMRLAGDTASLARSRQYEFWVERILGRAARWNVERLDPAAGFRGRAWHARVGAILLAEHLNDPFRIWRNPRDGSADDGWLYLVTSSVEAYAGAGREHRFAPNELVLIDSRRPLTLNNTRFARVRFMTIPRSAIPFAGSEDYAQGFRTIPPNRPLGRMLHGHFLGLFELVWNPETHSCETAALAARQLLDLLAAFCAARPEESVPPVSDAAAMRYRDALNLMRRYCSDPELTPEEIAARAGLSRASLYRLFQAHQTRFSAELARIRLEHAHTLLAAGGHGRIRLTDVAMNSGFANSSVFSRRFRDAFQQTPSEYLRGLRRAD